MVKATEGSLEDSTSAGADEDDSTTSEAAVDVEVEVYESFRLKCLLRYFLFTPLF